MMAGPMEPAAPPAEVSLDMDSTMVAGRRLDVPEPGTLTSVGVALLAIGLVKRQRSQSR